MRRLATGLVLAGVMAIGACRWLLPERFAVNAPLAHLIFGRGGSAPPPESLGTRIRAREGLSVGLFAEGIPNARFLRFTPAGDLLVSQPREGRVLLLERDADGDGRADGRRVVLEGLDRPHGLEIHDGWLLVAEGSAIGRVRFDAASRTLSGEYTHVVSGLPTGGNHWTRSVRIGPDGWMYLSIGSSCNVCEESDPRRAAILRYRPDGSGGETFATGLRNAVGFDWRPGTGELYATDNGRDLLGDDFPPCELDLVVAGGFYGWPYANGANVPDPDLGAGREEQIRNAIPPAHGFRAHNAPLGIAFVRRRDAPADLSGSALVALHGSWNRTRKDGYKVVSLHWKPDGSIEERDFLVGFEQDGDVIGRPVDVAEGPDGAFYVSDDYAGAVYRVASPAGVSAQRSRGIESGETPDPLLTVPADERVRRATRGRALYEALACAGCHESERATPGVLPIPLGGLGQRHTLAGLSRFLASPTPPMPAVALEAEDRDDLAIFLLEEHR
jgi:glucose/arabinose dehydrogenase